MKRLSVLIAWLWVMGFCAVAEAAVRPVLQRMRGVATTTTVDRTGLISGSAEYITGVALTCGGTACAGGLYDLSSAKGLPTNALLMFELNAAANTTAYFDFSDTPIRASTGIVGVLDANGLAIVAFTEQTTP